MAIDNPVLETVDKFYNDGSNSNPSNGTTDDTTVTDEGVQEPVQDDKSLEKPTETVEESNDDTTSDSKTTQFIELDDKEISLDDVRKWRDGHLMQSDYTKKTTEHAEFAKKERASFDLERETLAKSKADVSEMQDTLTVLVAEDEAIDWVELKEFEPERYIELKEKADKRKAALEKVKAERETPADDPALIVNEQEKLYKAHPDWLDENKKPTEAFTKDITLMNEYAVKAGFSEQEFTQMTRAHYLTTVLKAAKYDQLQEKGRKIKEKREKVPVVTKPKAAKTNEQPRSMEDIFYSS